MGKCFVCDEECKMYAHKECAILYSDAKRIRVKKVIEKYGEGIRGTNVLIKQEDLK